MRGAVDSGDSGYRPRGRGFTLDQALDDLVRLSSVDLDDHFSFEYAGHTDSFGNDTQPYTEGYEVKFTIYIGGASKGTLRSTSRSGQGLPESHGRRAGDRTRSPAPGQHPTASTRSWTRSPTRSARR